jgi:hypothetical protein
MRGPTKAGSLGVPPRRSLKRGPQGGSGRGPKLGFPNGVLPGGFHNGGPTRGLPQGWSPKVGPQRTAAKGVQQRGPQIGVTQWGPLRDVTHAGPQGGTPRVVLKGVPPTGSPKGGPPVGPQHVSLKVDPLWWVLQCSLNVSLTRLSPKWIPQGDSQGGLAFGCSVGSPKG